MTKPSKQIVREYYEQIVSGGVLDRVGEYIAPDYEEVHEGQRYPLGGR